MSAVSLPCPGSTEHIIAVWAGLCITANSAAQLPVWVLVVLFTQPGSSRDEIRLTGLRPQSTRKRSVGKGPMKGRVGARRVLPYVSASIRWRARCVHRSSTRWPPLPCYWAQRSSSHHMRRRCSQQHPPVLIRLFTEQRPCSKCGTYAGEGHMVIDAPISCSRMFGTCGPMPTGALNGITHIIPTTGVVA